ncbi:hypothetical protein F6450_05480 [Photobacterium damselae subsp. damselae]|uniref:NlpC/P60 domain-containing protein n=1 Tax=Photobacterium damselae subsp. damselae TaxID=85581 RepID=A0AAD3ZWL9_PHODD|nr:hypothetical protein F6450_05480 [Photobacterium damselae subsp. damselae]MCG3816245.1 C40 family peptidase [Photobacterium damselae]
MIKTNRNKTFLFVGLLVSLVTGCSSTEGVQSESNKQASANYTENQPDQIGDLIASLSQGNKTKPQASGGFSSVYRSWKGTPYRYGGTTRRGIDCSAFVQVGYSNVYDLALPRTTAEQVKKGKKISRANAREGDLVFFRTGRNSRHVGIYLGNSEFLHASRSKGVIISSLDNPYWRRTFWQIRRMPK